MGTVLVLFVVMVASTAMALFVMLLLREQGTYNSVLERPNLAVRSENTRECGAPLT